MTQPTPEAPPAQESEQNAPADPPKPTPPKSDDGADKATPEKDWQAEAEKWKALARKHEDQSKSNADKAKQFDEITEAQKSELEKAQERAAKAEAQAAETEARAIRAEVAAEKGIPGDLLNGTTREELEASADALIAFRGEKPKPDFGAGDRGTDVGSKVGQWTKADLDGKSAEEINKARKDGLLDDLLNPKK